MEHEEQGIRIRVAVAIIDGGKILLVQHEKHGRRYWLLPGGGVKYGETLKAAAGRELMEETGYEVEVGDLFMVSESIPPDLHLHVINLYYWGRIVSGRLHVTQDIVLRDAQWIDPADLPHLTIYPAVARELIAAIETGSAPQRSIGNRWE